MNKRTYCNWDNILNKEHPVAEVEEIVEVGDLTPESIVTPGIFVQSIVKGDHYDPIWVD